MDAKEITNDQKILKQFAERLVEDLKKEIPVVTGKTRNSIEMWLTEHGFRIAGEQSIGALIDGRRPTENDTAGNPTLQQIILKWIQAKGITSATISQLALSYAISKSIHKKGTLLFQRGGVNNFLEQVWKPERIDTFTEQFSGTLRERTIDYLLENFVNNEQLKIE